MNAPEQPDPLNLIEAQFPRARPLLVAVAGPPASGKTTLAHALAQQVQRRALALPMDGFHQSNQWLDARDLRARKGAPETFDARDFVEAVQNLALGGQAAWPGFDRSLDAVVPDALAIPHDVEVLLVEGNYLLLDQPVWRDLAPLWDLVFWIEVDEATLLARLIQRWLDEGLTPVAAEDRARTNDLVNARTVQSQSHLKNAVVLGA